MTYYKTVYPLTTQRPAFWLLGYTCIQKDGVFKMKAWFQRFMSGRYGSDTFGNFLCVTALVCLSRRGQYAQDVSSTRYRRRRNGVAVVRHDVLLRITVVYLRLEYNNPLTGESCPLDAAYKFLCLSREHGAAHHFYSSLAMEFAC